MSRFQILIIRALAPFLPSLEEVIPLKCLFSKGAVRANIQAKGLQKVSKTILDFFAEIYIEKGATEKENISGIKIYIKNATNN